MAPTRPSRPPRSSLPRLVALLEESGVAVEVAGADPAAVAVSGVTLDSRAVQPGDLWVAAPGATAHGATFAATALERGAAAVLTDAVVTAAGSPTWVEVRG